MKNFFSTQTLQSDPKNSKLLEYVLDKSCGKMENIKTRNPIMPFLRNNVEPGESVELYLCVIIPIKEPGESEEAYNERTREKRAVMQLHKKYFEENLEEIKNAVGGFDCEIKLIEMSGDSNNDYLKLMRNIVNNIADGDIIFMDISFGFKPVSIVQFLALTYAYKVRRGVEIGAMVYGNAFGTAAGKETLYNLTELFLLNNTMNNLTDLPHPEQLVDRILNNMIGEDEGQ